LVEVALNNRILFSGSNVVYEIWPGMESQKDEDEDEMGIA